MSFKVVGIGELLWDLLPHGRRPGGAPANFVCHARALGADSSMVTCIGNDHFGSELLLHLQKRGINTEAVQVAEAPTGTVGVTLSNTGLPEFTIHENVAWDRIALAPEALRVVAAAEAVCFGTLAQRNSRSRETIQTLLSTVPGERLRICDLNLRQHYFSRDVIEQSLRVANVLKLNEAELRVIAELLRLRGGTRDQIENLAQRFDLETIAFTQGASGSMLFQRGQWLERNAEAVKVVDTVGAGDAFTAALALGLLRGANLDAVHATAAELAGYVCSQSGATPWLPKSFSERLAAL